MFKDSLVQRRESRNHVEDTTVESGWLVDLNDEITRC